MKCKQIHENALNESVKQNKCNKMFKIGIFYIFHIICSSIIGII